MDSWLIPYKAMWDEMPPNARETLVALCTRGPLWDGDVPSKEGRDFLLKYGLAAKIVLKNNAQGYQAATYKGSHAYRAGVVEPRKESVRKLVPSEHVSTR